MGDMSAVSLDGSTLVYLEQRFVKLFGKSADARS